MVDPEAGDERADATRERMFGVICFYEGRRDVSSSGGVWSILTDRGGEVVKW